MSRSAWKTTIFHPLTIPSRNASDISITTTSTSSPTLFFQNRSSYISEQRMNYRISVYNGQRWFTLVVTPERVGHRVGEFSPTRKRPIPKKKKQVKKK